MMPGTGKGKTAYEKIRDRARFRRRASVEPFIGHLKNDYRMLRNYLRGVKGDMINTIMAATAFNMMKRLRQIRDAIFFCPGFTDWLLVGKIYHCTHLLKNTTF
jgi:IS5 family transposase